MILKLSDRGSLVQAIQRKLGITADGVFGKQTNAALKQFQAEKGLVADGIAGRLAFKALGLPHFTDYVINGTDKNVAWELPKGGKGYRVYNPERRGDQFGRKEVIEKLVKIGADWHEKHPEIDLQIGDISRIYGGKFPPHSSHRDGRAADCRPFRKDGKYIPVDCRNAEYSRELMREFLQLVKGRARVLFNDDVLIRENLCSFSPGHFNHSHLIL